MQFRHRLAIALASLWLSAAPLAAQAKRVATVDDLMRLKTVTDVQLSPDGSKVAYVVTVPVVDKNEHDSDVWLVPAAGGEPIQLTNSPKGDQSPRWSPDGRRIAFVSMRDGPPNIYLLDLRGGEPRKLTRTEGGVQGFAWSPDGGRIAFTSADPPSEERKQATEATAGVIVVDEHFPMARLRVVDLASDEVVTLTGSDRHVTAMSWAPDGTRLVVSAQPTPRVPDGDLSDLLVVPADSGTVRSLVSWEGPDGSPAWSPDGSEILFVSGGGRNELGESGLYVVSPAGGAPRRLAASYDRDFAEPVWGPDGAIYFGSVDGVRIQVMRLAKGRATPTALTSGDRVHAGFSLSADGRTIALRVLDPSSPPEIFVSAVDRYQPRRLTTTNPMLDSLSLGAMKVVRWKSTDGMEIEGLLIEPVGAVPGRRFPVLTYVHGGPTGVFTLGFEPQMGAAPFPIQAGPYPLQVFAGKGYGLFMPNPRGSSGYGKAFLRANVDDWGHGDFADIMSGLDHLVAQGLADPARLGLMGWSYGGYMTSWAITQTDRFKAASVGAGLPNLFSMHGNTDIPGTLREYFGDVPWRAKERYERSSAMYHADNIKTPTLIQHGEKDDRVQLGQAWELYRALEDRKVPRLFVIYPRQGHLIIEPKQQRDMMTRNLDWFTWYVRTQPVP
ncbi:MAG: S9 family peptidase [Gemmatimonadales bacterium]